MNTIIRTAGALVAGLLATVAFTGSAQAATTKVQITAKVGSQELALNALPTSMAVPRPRIAGATFQTWTRRDVGNFATYESVHFPGRCLTAANRSGAQLGIGVCVPGKNSQLWTQGFGSATFKKFENLESGRVVSIEINNRFAVMRFDSGLTTQRWRIRQG
jgi:hypothetical protein